MCLQFVKKDQLFIYLEEFNEEALSNQLDELFANIGFSDTEAKLSDVENAVRFAIEITQKQGGKLNLILGNNCEYIPKVADSDKTKRGFFYASDLVFSRLAGDMHKYFTCVDLYLFGHKKNKNLGSLAEFTRLSGGDICYYETTEPSECILKSSKILQRFDFQSFESKMLGNCF